MPANKFAVAAPVFVTNKQLRCFGKSARQCRQINLPSLRSSLLSILYNINIIRFFSYQSTPLGKTYIQSGYKGFATIPQVENSKFFHYEYCNSPVAQGHTRFLS